MTQISKQNCIKQYSISEEYAEKKSHLKRKYLPSPECEVPQPYLYHSYGTALWSEVRGV